MTARPDLAPVQPFPEGYRLAELTSDDRLLVESIGSWAFAEVPRPDEADLRPFPLQTGRMVGVWTDHVGPSRLANGLEAAADPRGTLVAAHASYAFTTFGVPGGTLPTAGLSWVSVHPQHRRRGLARAMVTAHLRRTSGRGEPISALFASEPGIYGRYGYGRASHHSTVTLGHRPELRAVAGAADLTVTMAHADFGEHAELVRTVHDSSRRPGWARRTTPELEAGMFVDPPSERAGREPLRIAAVWDEAGRPRAYALFSRKAHWAADGTSEGVVEVREAVAPDGAAAHALWTFLTDLDLMATVRSPMLAVDDPLLTLLVDTRTVHRRTTDNVWVRLVDVPAALAGRSYAAPLDVVLEVRDELLPANAGRWRLRAVPLDPGTGSVEPTTAAADLALDVRELATAYLGGVSLASLGAAGLVDEHTPGSLAASSTAFGWPDAPVTSWIF